jgi:hypothetical protein
MWILLLVLLVTNAPHSRAQGPFGAVRTRGACSGKHSFSPRPENHIFCFKVPEMPLKAHASSAVGAKNRSTRRDLRYRGGRGFEEHEGVGESERYIFLRKTSAIQLGPRRLQTKPRKIEQTHVLCNARCDTPTARAHARPGPRTLSQGV